MKTEIEWLDNEIGGLNPSWFIVWLAATKGGKSIK